MPLPQCLDCLGQVSEQPPPEISKPVSSPDFCVNRQKTRSSGYTCTEGKKLSLQSVQSPAGRGAGSISPVPAGAGLSGVLLISLLAHPWCTELSCRAGCT